MESFATLSSLALLPVGFLFGCVGAIAFPVRYITQLVVAIATFTLAVQQKLANIKS